MNEHEKKINPSEDCEPPKWMPISSYTYPESTYTGADDDDPHSPHWMDRHHDYGGGSDQ